jgi:hypothetical protein
VIGKKKERLWRQRDLEKRNFPQGPGIGPSMEHIEQVFLVVTVGNAQTIQVEIQFVEICEDLGFVTGHNFHTLRLNVSVNPACINVMFNVTVI